MVNLISVLDLIPLAVGHHKVSFACDDVRAPSIHKDLANFAFSEAPCLLLIRNGRLLIQNPTRSRGL